MSSAPRDAPPSLRKHTPVRRLADNIFAANLSPELCIGSVPNGGYVGSIFLRVAQEYLAPRNQPDTIQIHLQFLNRTDIGPAYFVVEEVKPGRNMSVLHISLHQHGILQSHPWLDPAATRRSEVVAYATNLNIDKEQGISLPTEFILQQKQGTVPSVDFQKLASGADPNWTRLFIPIMRRRSLDTLLYYVPRKGVVHPSVQDYWIRLGNGDKFDNITLGYVADCVGAFIPETYRQTDAKEPLKDGQIPIKQAFWYPTITMSLDIKKRLDGQSDEWLRLRASSKQISNGRYDIEIIIFDSKGNLVALSNHCAMLVDFAKNLKGREQPKEKI